MKKIPRINHEELAKRLEDIVHFEVIQVLNRPENYWARRLMPFSRIDIDEERAYEILKETVYNRTAQNRSR